MNPPSSTRRAGELGPVLCDFLLADGINRAPAAVPSALLERVAMPRSDLAHGEKRVRR